MKLVVSIEAKAGIIHAHIDPNVHVARYGVLVSEWYVLVEKRLRTSWGRSIDVCHGEGPVDAAGVAEIQNTVIQVGTTRRPFVGDQDSGRSACTNVKGTNWRGHECNSTTMECTLYVPNCPLYD